MQEDKYTSIKQILCDFLVEVKEDNNYTYDWLVDNTKFNRTQWVNIIKHDGKDVSADAIYSVIKELGYGVQVMFYEGEYLG